MKLYRGLKTSEFKYYSDDVAAELRRTLRLQRQHFTDRREIALNYLDGRDIQLEDLFLKIRRMQGGTCECIGFGRHKIFWQTLGLPSIRETL